MPQYFYTHLTYWKTQADSCTFCPFPQSDVPLCINSCCPRHGVLRTVGWRSGAELGTLATRLLSQLAVGSEECGAPCRGGEESEGGGGVRGRRGACGAHYLPPAAGWSWRPKRPRCRRSSWWSPCPSGRMMPGSWSSWTDPE